MEEVKRLLAIYKKKMISLAELEQLLHAFVHTYEDFASIIVSMEKEGILSMVKSKGRTSRSPSLAFQYKINKNAIVGDYQKELQHYRRILHPSINLDNYYREEPSVWRAQLPYILKIDQYIKEFSFPEYPVPAPERSYELVGDEKWIMENDGKGLLEKIGLFSHLLIIPVSEPLMFAINPERTYKKTQFHLIVENKTTYQGLLPTLIDTEFSTLIYGSGKAIIKNIEQFSMQYPVPAAHHFFYFGDIDKEGISIWASLNKKQPVSLALPFYLACLEKEPATGKGYQRERTSDIDLFVSFFETDHQAQIHELYKQGMYHPQETLKTKELQEIWRNNDWSSMR